MCLETWPALNKLGKFHVSGVWKLLVDQTLLGGFLLQFHSRHFVRPVVNILWVDFMVTSLTNDEWIGTKFSNEANGNLTI